MLEGFVVFFTIFPKDNDVLLVVGCTLDIANDFRNLFWNISAALCIPNGSLLKRVCQMAR
jgi:hypothetical protein